MGKVTPTSVACQGCGGAFIALRIGHKYCSDTCRKKAFKASKQAVSAKKRSRRLSLKLKKLSTNSFGQYLVRELRRAGSVEVLRGHNKDTLNELVALRKACNRFSGYGKDAAIGSYELSHIYPVNGKVGLGRLHPVNLVITSREFNRSRGSKEPEDEVLRVCDYALLENKWVIPEGAIASKILKMARSFLGVPFDTWLSSFVLIAKQTETLTKKLRQYGYTKKALEVLTFEGLCELMVKEDQLVFQMEVSTARPFNVALAQLTRLYPNHSLTKTASLIHEVDYALNVIYYDGLASEAELVELALFIVDQANLLLHNLPYQTRWHGRELNEWISGIKEPIRTNNDWGSGHDDDDIL
jgi:hypothetical protein